MGDGNVGARNAYFKLGSGTGIVIFVLDVIKGMLPVLVARAVALPEVVILAAGAVTVAGHNWPIFPGFRGRTRGVNHYRGAVCRGNSTDTVSGRACTGNLVP